MRILSYLLLFLVSLTVTASSKKYEYVLKVDRSAMAVVDSDVVVSLQLTAIQDVPMTQSVIIAPELIDTTTLQRAEFPLIFINSRNQQIYFERELKNEFPEAIALQKKNGEDLHISYLRTVKYEPWMGDAVLKIKKLSCACKDFKDRGEETLASFKKEEMAPVIELFPVYLLPPADKRVKVREEKGSAYLCFVVNKWDILPDYMNNPAELQKIHNSVNIVKNDSNVTIRKMVIEGYASPEGSNAHNIMLSEKRTASLQHYLERTGRVKGIRLEARGKGENWDGFISYLKKNTSVPQHDKLLSIATAQIDPDAKERRMRAEAAEGYAYVLKNVFPELRCTNYTVEYTVRPFTVDESEVVFETRPINLNLNEIYKLADKYANDEKKYTSIIRKAYLLYPQDSYINLTMAYLSLKKGEADEAAEYLTKVNSSPQKTMNESIVAYLKGDLDKAVQLAEKARSQGVPEASEQLKEYGKLTKKK